MNYNFSAVFANKYTIGLYPGVANSQHTFQTVKQKTLIKDFNLMSESKYA